MLAAVAFAAFSGLHSRSHATLPVVNTRLAHSSLDASGRLSRGGIEIDTNAETTGPRWSPVVCLVVARSRR